MTNPNKLADAQIRLIRDLTDAFDECEKVAPVCDCRDNSGEPYPSQWLADVRVRAAKFLAAHDAQPATSSVQVDEHEAKIIADLDAMASNKASGYWPQALAIGALQMIRALQRNLALHARPPAPAADGADELEQAELWVANHCHEPAMEKTLFAAVAALRQPVPDAETAKLIEFFRKEGYMRFGLNGDNMGWSPAETAIRAMREYMSKESSLSQQPEAR